MMMKSSPIGSRYTDEWPRDGDNNNYIDHLQKDYSVVCIRELEVVVDAASTGGPKSARSS